MANRCDGLAGCEYPGGWVIYARAGPTGNHAEVWHNGMRVASVPGFTPTADTNPAALVAQARVAPPRQLPVSKTPISQTAEGTSAGHVSIRPAGSLPAVGLSVLAVLVVLGLAIASWALREINRFSTGRRRGAGLAGKPDLAETAAVVEEHRISASLSTLVTRPLRRAPSVPLAPRLRLAGWVGLAMIFFAVVAVHALHGSGFAPAFGALIAGIVLVSLSGGFSRGPRPVHIGTFVLAAGAVALLPILLLLNVR